MYHGAGRPEKQEAGSGIPARERTGNDGRTLPENDGSVRSFPIVQAALFREPRLPQSGDTPRKRESTRVAHQRTGEAGCESIPAGETLITPYVRAALYDP